MKNIKICKDSNVLSKMIFPKFALVIGLKAKIELGIIIRAD